MDWLSNREEIVLAIERGDRPLKIHSMLPSFHIMPKSNADFLSRFPKLKIRTVSYDQSKIIENIRQSKYQLMTVEEQNLDDYFAQVMSDKKKHNQLKCYEDLIPVEFVDDIQKIFDKNAFRPLISDNVSLDYYYRFFYGLKSQTTSPHFDWSPFGSILIQLYGEKEIILFDTSVFGELEFYYNYVDFDFFAIKQYAKNNNIKYESIRLFSGEALSIPPYWLHAVDYISDSSSLSLRLLPDKIKSKIHRAIPANFLLAYLLDKLPKSNLLTEELANHLIKQKDYRGLIDIYNELALKHYNLKIKHCNESLKYEEHMFNLRREVEFHMNEKFRRMSLVKRGAAYFSTL